MNQIQTKPLCASSSNLADMLTMVNTIDFGGHSSKVKVTMGIILTNEGCAGMLCFALLHFLIIYTEQQKKRPVYIFLSDLKLNYQEIYF